VATVGSAVNSVLRPVTPPAAPKTAQMVVVLAMAALRASSLPAGTLVGAEGAVTAA